MRRRKSREIALQALFSFEVNPVPYAQLEKNLKSNFASELSPEHVDFDFMRIILTSAIDRRDEIDVLLENYSNNWKLSRMARVDRNILRLAAAELLACNDIASSVTIDEAVMLAKRFGTEDSASFVNGIIDQVWKNLPENPAKAKSY